MKRNQKIKGQLKSKHYQPASSEKDAEELIKTIGEKRREVLRMETNMNDEIAIIKQKYEIQATPLKDEVSELVWSVQTWAETNRWELTRGGKTKTVKLATGEVNWRNRPPRVSIRNKVRVIETLKKLGLTGFIRTIEDINKEAMLQDIDRAEAITGVSIDSVGEDFAIEPYELEIENKQ